MLERIKEQIEIIAMEFLKPAMDDYASKIWADIQEDVINDVLECAVAAEDGGFTDGDVALAIGRAISKRSEGLTPNEYQKAVMQATNLPDGLDMLTHAVLSLTMETGAVVRVLGRTYQGYPANPVFLKKKLSNCLQAIAKACTAAGLTLEDIME